MKIILEEFDDILIIYVREGSDKPYKSSSGFYTRIGPNSQKLSRDEIVGFFKSEGKVRFDELVNQKFSFDTHFDEKKFDRFLRLAGISKVIDIPDILINLGTAEKQEGEIIFNNTGVLFFSKNLQDVYFHTAVTCALYKGTEKVDVLDRRDFNEDIIGNNNGAVNFLKQYIPIRYKMTGRPRREEIPEIPYDALREAVINAVAHRDYFEKGANVMVEMFDDRIEITNPGGLVKTLRPEDFGKKSVLRNPNIANLLHRTGYIEKMGTGINKIRRLIAEAGLSPVKFEFSTFFTAVFKRPIREKVVTPEKIGGVSGGVNGGVFGGITPEVGERLMKVLIQLSDEKPQNIKELSKVTGISKRTLERDISTLKSKGFIDFIGAPKTGGYVLTEEGKQLVGKIRK